MHACIIETAITEREFLSVVHSEPCGIRNRSPTTECFYIGKLHTSGLRNIIYKKNHYSIEGVSKSDWSITILINFQAFLLSDNLHSYDPTSFNSSEIINQLEQTLSSTIRGYIPVEHAWRFTKIEYSKDFYIDKAFMNHILRTCDYLDSRKKMEFITYSSGIEFCSKLKNGQKTAAFHIYYKQQEKLRKGYSLTPDEMSDWNFFRIESILYRDSIGDYSRENGFPLGDLDCFANSYMEDQELIKMLNAIYGESTYRKRKDAVNIIKQGISSVSMQNKLISLLDKINRTSISAVRNEFKSRNRLQIYNSYVARLNNLDINLAYLPYNYPVSTLPALTKQIFY